MTFFTRAGFQLLVLCLMKFVMAQNDTSGEISIPIRIDNNSELSITCKECTVHGDISLSGGTGNTPDSNFSSLPFDFTEWWAGAVVEDFDVHIELAFLLTPTNATNEIIIPLFTFDGHDGFTYQEEIPPLFSIDWTFDPIIHGWVNSSKTVNFTYGFDFTIPANSALFIPILHLDEIKSIGFSSSIITPLNYISPDPGDDFTFELSFRPIFKVDIDVFDTDTGIFAEVFADVPKLDITVAQVHNVTRDCLAAPPGTASDQIFSNLTYVVPTLGFDIGFNATAIGVLEFPVGNNISLPTSCLDYSEKTHALGTVPDKSNDGDRMKSQGVAVGCALFMALVINLFGL